MPGKALEDWLEEAGGSPAVRSTVLALARAAVSVSGEIHSAAQGVAPSDRKGAHADVRAEQKTLERYGNDCFLDEVRAAPVALYASGETEQPTLLDATAPLAVAVDSLDGSVNIDINMPIGTIFAILPVVGDAGRDGLPSLLQSGANQVASGFFCYGPRLVLAITLGQGTHVFVYGSRVGAFLRSHVEVQIPRKTDEFAVDISNQRHWESAIRHYVDDCLNGSEGPHGRDFTMRWTESLVAEAYRILLRGGVFLYPSDSRRGYAHGRLRLVYQANPIALLIQQAGGLATDGVNPILSQVPLSLHQSTPLVFGSSNEVNQVLRYHDGIDHAGIHSPLFSSRGLFRK
jgi:fructose-1,6-bisphosphatase I